MAHALADSPRLEVSSLTAGRADSLGRILVVDGDPDTVRSIARALQHEGYFTATAFDSAGATHVFDHLGPFDLLIAGLHLTPTNGVDLAQSLRRRDPDLQILYLTNCRDELFATPIPVSPDDEVIEQPFSEDELLDAVSALLYWQRRPRRAL